MTMTRAPIRRIALALLTGLALAAPAASARQADVSRPAPRTDSPRADSRPAASAVEVTTPVVVSRSLVRSQRDRPVRRRSRAARLAWGLVLGLLLAFVIRTWVRGGRVPEPPREGSR